MIKDKIITFFYSVLWMSPFISIILLALCVNYDLKYGDMKYWHKEEVCVICNEVVKGQYNYDGVCPFCGYDDEYDVAIKTKSQIVRYKVEWYRLWKPIEKEYLMDVPSPDINSSRSSLKMFEIVPREQLEPPKPPEQPIENLLKKLRDKNKNKSKLGNKDI